MSKLEARNMAPSDHSTNNNQDLYAIYENLHESFLDLTFKNLGGSASSNRHERKPSFNKYDTQSSSSSPKNMQATFSFPKLDEGEEDDEHQAKQQTNHHHHHQAINHSTKDGRITADMKVDHDIIIGVINSAHYKLNSGINFESPSINGEIKLNQGIKHQGAEEGIGAALFSAEDEVTKRALSESSSSSCSRRTSLGDVLGGKLKRPSSVGHNGKGVQARSTEAKLKYKNEQQLPLGGAPSNDTIMQEMRTPPRSKMQPPQRRFNRCYSCNKFLLFFKIQCSDCTMWFCTKCAKKYPNEGNKCKSCSFGRLKAKRRSKEKQGLGRASSTPNRKDNTESTSYSKHPVNVAQQSHRKHQSTKIRATGSQDSYKKLSQWTLPTAVSPSLSPRRKSHHALTQKERRQSPLQSPRRHSSYQS